MTEPDKPLTLDDLLREVQPIANRVSKTVVRHFEEYIETEDLVQNLMVWGLENQEKVREWLTPTEDDERCVIGRRNLHTTLRRLARGSANEAKAARLGYSVYDLHWYSATQVSMLLKMAFNYDDWSLSSQGGGTSLKTKSDPAVGNNLPAMLADVKWSFETGNEADRDLLWAIFVEEVDELELAALAGVTRQTIVRRGNRALGRLVDRLGGTRPTFGAFTGRTAVSNAMARYVTDNPFEAPETIRRIV